MMIKFKKLYEKHLVEFLYVNELTKVQDVSSYWLRKKSQKIKAIIKIKTSILLFFF